MRVDLNRDFHEKINYISLFHQCKIIPGRISARLNEAGVNAAQNKNLFLSSVMIRLFCDMCRNSVPDKITVTSNTSAPHFFHECASNQLAELLFGREEVLPTEKRSKKKETDTNVTLGQVRDFPQVKTEFVSEHQHSAAGSPQKPSGVCASVLEDHSFHWFSPGPSPGTRSLDCLNSRQTRFLIKSLLSAHCRQLKIPRIQQKGGREGRFPGADSAGGAEAPERRPLNVNERGSQHGILQTGMQTRGRGGGEEGFADFSSLKPQTGFSLPRSTPRDETGGAGDAS